MEVKPKEHYESCKADDKNKFKLIYQMKIDN